MALSGVLPVPPGASWAGNYTVNSAIAGVPLTGGGSLSVALVEPGTMYSQEPEAVGLCDDEDVQVRQRAAAGPAWTFYNVLNASTATTVNQSSAPVGSVHKRSSTRAVPAVRRTARLLKRNNQAAAALGRSHYDKNRLRSSYDGGEKS